MLKAIYTLIYFYIIGVTGIYSQQLSQYVFEQEITAYNEISGGTLLPAADDEGFANIDLGFNFSFAGNTFTKFGVNANGYIVLGTTDPLEINFAQYYYDNVIFPLHTDLVSDISGGATELKYLVSGSAPNRLLTVQWKNWDPKFFEYYDSSFAVNFQVRLYETSNKVEFQYGFIQKNAAEFFQYFQPYVGLRGSTVDEFRTRDFDWNNYGWLTSLEGTSIYATMLCYDTVVPPLGLTYKFTAPAPVAMSYISSTTTQNNTSPVYLGKKNQEIIRVEITTAGNTNPFALTQINFNTNGSTNPPADLSNAKVFYTGSGSTYDTAVQYGSTVLNPNGSFIVNGNMPLGYGVNYFWLSFDIKSTAAPGNFVDAGCTQLVMTGAGSTRIPSIQVPAGNRVILCNDYIGSNTTSLEWPFTTYLQSRKTQLLYTADEIRAMCIDCNIFHQIGFQFNSNVARTLQNFQVKMRNTGLTSFGASFVSDSLVTVFSGSFTTGGPGWQYITFQNDFDWDGVRNVIIQICFQNPAVLPVPVPEVSGSYSTSGNHAILSSGSGPACNLTSGSAFNIKPDLKIVTSSAVNITSRAVQQNIFGVLSGSANNEILMLPVVLKKCGTDPVNITSFSFNTNGSSNAAGDISAAKVFCTGNSKIFSTGNQFGSIVNNPNGSFSVSGNITLLNDTNYFWLSYDIRSTAVHLNVVDAEFTSFIAGGNTVIPFITAPAGNRPINALGAMSGVYYVGTGKDFTTITAALNGINLRGISSTVTLLLADTSYPVETLPMVIKNDIAGLGGSNFLIIKPAPAVNVNISDSASAGDNNIFRINGSNVVIDGSNTTGGITRNLFINNTRSDMINDGPRAINIKSENSIPVNRVTIKNCRLRVKALYTGSDSYGEVIKIGVKGSTNSFREFNDILIDNNEISGGAFGIYANANISPAFNSLYLKVTNNNLDLNDTNRIRIVGVFARGFENVSVTGNSIGNFYSYSEFHYSPDNNMCGIRLDCNNGIIERNKIFNLKINFGYTEGIRTSGANIKIANNFIYDILSYLFETFGIISFSDGKLQIVNNSVNLYGIPADSIYDSKERCLFLKRPAVNTDTITVKNNIFSIKIPNPNRECFLLDIYDSLVAGKNYINNNCYYFDEVSLPRFKLNITGVLNITDSVFDNWKNNSQFDENSFSLNPGFQSNDNLHINPVNLSVNGRGAYVTGLVNDIDGETRPVEQSGSESPVDVGADQYTPSGFTGNTAMITGNIYKDGFYPAIGVVSGSFTASSVKIFPGVRSSFGALSRFSGKPINKDNANLKAGDNLMQNKLFPAVHHENMISNTPWIYWVINGFNPVSQPITLKFYYNEEQLAAIPELNLRMAVFNGSAWDSNFTQIVNTDSNFIQVTFQSGYGWAVNPVFSLIYSDTPLPVLLSEFTSTVQNRDVKLDWVTEAELNNRGFSVERRIKQNDNSFSNWNEIAFLEGSGSTNSRQEYSFSDLKLNKGIFQYRLKQIDYNGNFEYHSLTGEIVIGVPANFDLSQNYPNPSNPLSKIDFQLPFDAKVNLKVYDLLGREVVTLINEIRKADFYSVEFDGSDLASGVYFYQIVITGGDKQFTKTKKMLLIK